MTAPMRIAIATMALILASVSAHASTLTLTKGDPLFSQGSQQGNISLQSPAVSTGVKAGEFSFDVSNDLSGLFGDELLGFCIDVTNTLKNGSYTVQAIEDSSFNAVAGWLGNLFDTHYDSISNGAQSAAFQLAIWEIIYDAGNFDLGTGNFRASNFSTAIGIAEDTFLDGLQNQISSQYQFYVLLPDNPTNNQAILTWKPKPVPEPGSLALIALGLLLVLGLRQRRLQTRAV
ncbi:MAG: PEP-CTERM sorting domain-containing protein [Gammaproteobacteria bacterium]|nr:PEP-CTERM sorting domain-containing protein [Gammaproteobacteria bacterium]